MVRRPVLRPQEVALIRGTQKSQNKENIINIDGKYFSKSSAEEAHMKKGKLGAYAIKRVAAGAHLPTPLFF